MGSEDDLLALFRRAWPYRDLEPRDFMAIVVMLAEGFTTRRGRRGAHVHHDAVNEHAARPPRGAPYGLTAGGAIPERPTTRWCWSRRPGHAAR